MVLKQYIAQKQEKDPNFQVTRLTEQLNCRILPSSPCKLHPPVDSSSCTANDVSYIAISTASVVHLPTVPIGPKLGLYGEARGGEWTHIALITGKFYAAECASVLGALQQL